MAKRADVSLKYILTLQTHRHTDTQTHRHTDTHPPPRGRGDKHLY